MAVVFMGCLAQLGLLGLAGYWAATGFWWGAGGLAAALLGLNVSRPFNVAMMNRMTAGRPSDEIARDYRLAERRTRVFSPLPGHRAGRRAQVLHLEGQALADAGSHQEAAGRLAEAAGLRRAGAERDRRRGPARLSATLDLYATVLAALDRHEESVAAMAEAVAAAERQLALRGGERAPRQVRTTLGLRLLNLGVHLRDAGLPERGLEAAGRAGARLEPLCSPAGRPAEQASLLRLLAGAGTLRAECLAALGRTEEAVDAQRAVAALLDGRDARDGRRADPADRAAAWDRLSDRLHAAGRWEEADRAFQRAAAIRAVAARRAARAGRAARAPEGEGRRGPVR
ncbi:hypothetical protein GCM10018781_00250 [Kitasatospora indigofera]|uniref:Tetratricopeptide repeat protein n=1 Tax=Kitasatospora indigofera TaxID=67307 RepID=A0A919FAI5_9ACTN|nr:hypothetical protein [Kitasatospora indigofera]GHH58596.1 hypothetical protein GCM10018781_00250 [Kitasatospora indigofera]